MRWLLTLLIIITALPAAAEDDGKIWVNRMTDCGLWVKGRDQQAAKILEAYLVGTLNGLALGHGIEFWRADGTQLSDGAAFLWMDKFCHEHPLKNIVSGAMWLYQERSGWRPEE